MKYLQKFFQLRWGGMAALFLSVAFSLVNVEATTVTTIAGGPPNAAGYVDGETAVDSRFNDPMGMAFDTSGYLYVADYNNNAIRQMDLVNDLTWTFATGSHPVGITIDQNNNIYVLYSGNESTGQVVQYDVYGDIVATNATGLKFGGGIASDFGGDVYVTSSNQVVEVVTGQGNPLWATIPNAGSLLKGITVMNGGLLAVADYGRDGIYTINPSGGIPYTNFGGGPGNIFGNTNLIRFINPGIVSTNCGFNGAGDAFGPANRAKFLNPSGLLSVGNNNLIVADSGNNRVKVISNVGVVTNLYGVDSNYWAPISYSPTPGLWDGTVMYGPASLNYNYSNYVEARFPAGLAMDSAGTLYASEDYYHVIRTVTGANLPLAPTPPAKVAAPVIGIVNFIWDATIGTWVSHLDVIGNGGTTNLYNLATVAIEGASGSETYYDSSTNYPVILADPTTGSTAVPYFYADGILIGDWNYSSMVDPAPFITIKAMSASLGAPNSDVVSAQINYIVQNPSINGDNAAQFTITDPTTNAVIWYTIDGSDPNPANTSSASVSVGSTVSVNMTGTNLLVKAKAFLDGFQTSATVSNLFSSSSYSPNTISLGFASGEASSDFVGSPGQYFSVPVTLTVLPAQPIYSMVFNITVTNAAFTTVSNIAITYGALVTITNGTVLPISGGKTLTVGSGTILTVTNGFLFSNGTYVAITNETTVAFANGASVALPNGAFTIAQGTAFTVSPPVQPYTYGFDSELKKPGVIPGTYVSIPPYMFVDAGVMPTNDPGVTYYSDGWFQNLVTYDTSGGENLLSVGWIERYADTNLYNTLGQTLITYSAAHDILYSSLNGAVEVGAYGFRIPANAVSGSVYQIQLNRPSASGDGVGAPGSAVFIAAPTNGTLSALKNLVVGQRKYVAGSVYPFRWFNAGDFGSSNIVDSDLEQVYEQALSYPLRGQPVPANSDMYDALDSCGSFGFLDGNPNDANFNYYTNAYTYLDANQMTSLLSGIDITNSANQMAFGDGVLDVCDVYLSFLRSVDGNFILFQRFWNNGQLVAQPLSNIAPNSNVAPKRTTVQSKPKAVSGPAPQVNFTAGDFQGSPGQKVTIPITATVYGNYPARALMFNVTVNALDGSPALASSLQFSQTAAGLGSPASFSLGANGNNYSLVWLNVTNAGITGSTVIGNLSFTIPATASASSAYDVVFTHASASPNGFISLPRTIYTGLITLSSRTNSSYGDGIPDSWRLRWFGTTNNVLSVSNAVATTDGVDNWQKYVAGVDPTIPNDFPHLLPKASVPSGSTSAIHWPTVSGVQYVIQRSFSLYGGWTPVTTNTGTGTDMEFDDSATGGARFYRVQILP